MFDFLFNIIAAILSRKSKQEDTRQKTFDSRPELKIIDYEDHISEPDIVQDKRCDLEVCVVPIKNVITKNVPDNMIIKAVYDEQLFDKNEWCSVSYKFKNVGQTTISSADIVVLNQRYFCLFPMYEIEAKIYEQGILNYSEKLDKLLYHDDTFTLKIYYHKDKLCPSVLSASMRFYLQDVNGKYWCQPLFAPSNKIYKSRITNRQDFLETTNTETAINCFLHPGLW